MRPRKVSATACAVRAPAAAIEIEKPLVLRQLAAGWISAFVTVLIGALSLLLFGLASVVLAAEEFSIGVFLPVAAVAGVAVVLFFYVLRDARGKLGWRIGIGADALDLDLPASRSLTHRLKAVHARLRLDEIESVQTRLEAYRSFGMANMNRSYALRLHAGDVIVLGEDRAMGTQMASNFFKGVAESIVEHGKMELRDLGMAEGKGGVLSVLFTSPPHWDAPNLDAKKQEALWNRVTLTGALALIAPIVVLLVAIARLAF
jgi:hypothetical protein